MKNEHNVLRILEQDDIVNSLNYEGIAVISYGLPLSDSDRLRVGSTIQTK